MNNYLSHEQYKGSGGTHLNAYFCPYTITYYVPFCSGKKKIELSDLQVNVEIRGPTHYINHGQTSQISPILYGKRCPNKIIKH